MELISIVLSDTLNTSPTKSSCSLAELQRELAELENATPGPGDCPHCNGRGYTRVYHDNAWYTRECSCQKAEKARKRMERSGLGDLLRRYTFDSWETAEPWQRSVLKRATEYADNPQGWFCVGGPPGTGKTHLCTAICRKMLDSGRAVRYFRWVEDGRRLKASVNDTETYLDLCDPLKTIDVLYIDDLFKTRNGRTRSDVTDGDINLAFEIISSRYNSGKATIISSELSVNDMLGVDESTGSRIYEMAKKSGGYISIAKDRKNWRIN